MSKNTIENAENAPESKKSQNKSIKKAADTIGRVKGFVAGAILGAGTLAGHNIVTTDIGSEKFEHSIVEMLKANEQERLELEEKLQDEAISTVIVYNHETKDMETHYIPTRFGQNWFTEKSAENGVGDNVNQTFISSNPGKSYTKSLNDADVSFSRTFGDFEKNAVDWTIKKGNSEESIGKYQVVGISNGVQDIVFNPTKYKTEIFSKNQNENSEEEIFEKSSNLEEETEK